MIFAINCQASSTSDAKQLEAVANQGNIEAMLELGKMYEEGEGVIQDYIKAHMWYNLASSRGYKAARKSP